MQLLKERRVKSSTYPCNTLALTEAQEAGFDVVSVIALLHIDDVVSYCNITDMCCK